MLRKRTAAVAMAQSALMLLSGIALPAMAPPGNQAKAAFDLYADAAEQRIFIQQDAADGFLDIDRLSPGERTQTLAGLRHGDLLIRRWAPAPPPVPGGLIHHWIGDVFIPGASLETLFALLQDYDNLDRYYSPQVTHSRLLARSGGDFRAAIRMRQHKVVTIVLDTEYAIHYGRIDPVHAYSFSRSTRISEIENPGTRNEHALAPGHDHGFLWQLNSYWRFVQASDGVLVECEAISLTRDIPAGLNWLIAPLVESIPRESLAFTLQATRTAGISRHQPVGRVPWPLAIP